jgi:hypothetical protein
MILIIMTICLLLIICIAYKMRQLIRKPIFSMFFLSKFDKILQKFNFLKIETVLFQLKAQQIGR